MRLFPPALAALAARAARATLAAIAALGASACAASPADHHSLLSSANQTVPAEPSYRTFGADTDPPVLLLRGSPEVAAGLAAHGSYVVTYEKNDVEALVHRLGLRDPIVVGDGVLALDAIQHLPGLARGAVLTFDCGDGAPGASPETTLEAGLVEDRGSLYGIFGKRDGAFSQTEKEHLASLLSPEHIAWIERDDALLDTTATYLAALRAK